MGEHQPGVPCSHHIASCIIPARTLQFHSEHGNPRLRACVSSCCMVRVSFARPYPPGACEVPHQSCLAQSPTTIREAWFQWLAMWSGDSMHTVHCMATCCSACKCGCQWHFQHAKVPTHAQNLGEIIDTPFSCPVAHVLECYTPKHCHMVEVTYDEGGQLSNQRQ